MDDFTIVNKTVCLAAKRNSGKSVLINYLVSSNLDKFSKVFVICPTEQVNHFYKDIVDEDCIFDEWDEEWVERLIKKMTAVNAGKKKNTATNILLVCDDLVADANLHQSPTFKRLFTRGRHIYISIIFTTQYLLQVPPVTRGNSDYVLCGQMNAQSLKILCDEFHAGDIDKKEFLDLYRRATRDYGFFVINQNSVKGHSLDELYGCIRVPPEFIELL